MLYEVRSSNKYFSSAILLLFFLLLSVPMGAQNDPGTAEEMDSDRRAHSIPAERATARETMRTFLRGLIEADQATTREERQRLLSRAVGTLDLSGIPEAIRREQGETLAYELKADILDKYKRIEYAEIPNDPAGEPYVVLRSPSGLSIEIAKTGAGDWKFTRESVENIPEIATEFRGNETAEGIVEIDALKTPAAIFRESMPEWLQQPAFVLYTYQWLGMAVLAFLALVTGRLLVTVILSVFSNRLKAIGMTEQSDQAYVFNWPLGLVLACMIWWMFDGWLGLPPNIAEIIQYALVLVFGVSAIVMLTRLINVASEILSKYAAKTETKYDDLLIPFTRKTAKIIVFVVGPLMVYDNLGGNLGAILGTLAIGGLAISLAAKDTLSNLFGTVTIIADSPFQIGDWINVDGVDGHVETLGFRSTRVRTFYNSLVTIPNSRMLTAVVDNFGARTYRRYKTHVSVTYDTAPEKMEAFCNGIREILRTHPYTRKDYYHVYFHEYGAHSLDVLVYCFFKVPDWATELRERHRLNLDIYRLAKKLGIGFAFPTQTLYLERGQGPAQPDTNPLIGKDEIEALAAHSRELTWEIVESTTGPVGEVPEPVVIPPAPNPSGRKKLPGFDDDEA